MPGAGDAQNYDACYGHDRSWTRGVCRTYSRIMAFVDCSMTAPRCPAGRRYQKLGAGSEENGTAIIWSSCVYTCVGREQARLLYRSILPMIYHVSLLYPGKSTTVMHFPSMTSLTQEHLRAWQDHSLSRQSEQPSSCQPHHRTTRSHTREPVHRSPRLSSSAAPSPP